MIILHCAFFIFTYVHRTCIMVGYEETVPPETQEQEAEVHHLEVNPGEVTGDRQIIELPECPEHYPMTFVKGKPQSISDLPYISKKIYIEYASCLCIKYRS